MRLGLFLLPLFLLTACGTVTQYDANADTSPSSNVGSQGGGGVQTSIWSNDPSKKTVVNQAHTP